MEFILFYKIFFSKKIIIKYAVNPFNIVEKEPNIWLAIKIIFIINYFFISIFIIYFIENKYKKNSKKINNLIIKNSQEIIMENNLKITIGYNDYGEKISVPEKGLYQNFLITGTIGSGKTSSAMYPITQQLIEYNCGNNSKKIGMLVLDVKGNYYKKVQEYAKKYNRLNDIVVIELGGKYKYNPLDKPNVKASVLANRLKIILELFSGNTSESYWIDKSEEIICECIKLCRLYNDNYVSFEELHKLITNKKYYEEKIKIIKNYFKNNKYNQEQCYDLLSSIIFF